MNATFIIGGRKYMTKFHINKHGVPAPCKAQIFDGIFELYKASK